MVVLGAPPQDLTLWLVYGSDLSVVLESYKDGQPENYPAGTAITLEIYVEDTPTVFDATVNTYQATFEIDYLDVQTLMDQPGRKSARLLYENGSDRRLWASGQVKEAR